MLSINGVSQSLEAAYAEYKLLSRTIFDTIQPLATVQTLPGNVNLFELLGSTKVLYIVDGYFKLLNDGKTVRLYSESDFVLPATRFIEHLLTSEFSSDVAVFERQAFHGAFQQDAELLNRWTDLVFLENEINSALCGNYLEKQVKATFEMKEFMPGDTILKEGDAPEEILEMMTGEATVMLGDKQVGHISTGEIFGEIGFLTGQQRTATVVATSRCFLRAVNQDDFVALIKSNPHVGISIAKTLAQRIVDLNNRLIHHA